MRTRAVDDFPDLPDNVWERVETGVRAFEAAWAAGDRPRLNEFVARVGDPSGQLLIELVYADLQFRLEAGEPARVEDYLATFPDLGNRSAVLLGLLETEYSLRCRLGLRVGASGLADFEPPDDEPFPPSVRGDRRRRERTARVTLGQAEGDELPDLPGYEPLGELGRGGMGIVYQAVDVHLGRTVAVKTVRAGADRSERERLRREAEAAAKLQHPNVVQVHQVVEHGQGLFVVSEYLAGGTLAEKAGSEPMPAGEAAKIVEPLARGVAFAHSMGVIHRDLKPSNVLLTADGIPKVADFGLAKRSDDETALTRSGVLAGSPCYMAPEQAAGEPVGPAADVYALGVILYELLTGRPPFKGTTALETLAQVTSDEPVTPGRLVPAVPRDLQTICLKCLAKNPSERYPTADALADDLARFLRGESVLARPLSVFARSMRWASRYPAAAALVGLLAAAVSVGIAGSLWHSNRVAALAASAERSEKLTRRLLFAADMSAAADAVRDGDPVRAAELLAEHSERKTGTTFVWNHLDRLIHAPKTVIDRFGAPAYVACFSPDGRVLAASGADGRIRLYDAASWRRTEIWNADQGEINGLVFSPDGRRLASAGDDGSVKLWESPNGTEIWKSKVYDERAFQVAFGLGGTVLAACGNDPEIVLLSPDDGTVSARLPADEIAVEGIAVTPNGETLLSAGFAGRATAWNLRSRSERWHEDLAHADQRYFTAAASPDGRFAAFGSGQARVLVVDVETGKRLHWSMLPTLRHDYSGSACRCVTFLSENELVVADDAGRIRLFAVVNGAELQPLARQSRTGWTAGVSRVSGLTAFGRTIVSASRDGIIAAFRPDQLPPSRRVSLLQSSSDKAANDLVVLWPSGRENEIVATARGEAGIRLASTTMGRDHTLATDGDWESVAAAPEGRRFFAGGAQGELAAWTLRGDSPDSLWRRDLPWRGGVKILGITADGARLAVSVYVRAIGEDLIAIVDAKTGRVAGHRAFKDGINAAAIDGPGTALAVARKSEILLLDPTTMKTTARFVGPGRKVVCLRFSPDGRLLATGGDQEVAIWDRLQGAETRRWRADAGAVSSLAFSPDGTMLVTTSLAQPPRLWDVQTGKLLLDLAASFPYGLRQDERSPSFTPARFSPDGDQIVVGHLDAITILDGRPLER